MLEQVEYESPMAADLPAATEVDYQGPGEATLKLLRRSKRSQLPRYGKASGIRVNGGQSVTLTFHGTDSGHNNPTSHRSSNDNGDTVHADETVVDDPINCSVYLDQLHGKWKCHDCNWTYFIGSSHSGGLGNHRRWKCRHCNSSPSNRTWLGNHGAPIFSSEIKGAESINGAAEKNGALSNGLRHQHGPIACNGKLSASSQNSLNGLVEKRTWSGGYRGGGLDSMEETRKGPTESDVETVLEKQDTHDLYCPDCSSCITRRVVLNRRKDYGPNGHAMLLENEPEMAYYPMLDAESTRPDNGEVENSDISPYNASNPAADESSGEGRQPDVFRCLSWFRFFITEDDPVRATTGLQHGSQKPTAKHKGRGAREGYGWEILRSVVFGGLIESITSLGVVYSAAGAGAAPLNVVVMGLANLIGGLVIISYNLLDLKDDYSKANASDYDNDDEQQDLYQITLGKRENFGLHFIVAILSFLVCGLVPTITYGFTFQRERSSNSNKDEKLAAAGGASLVCIILLAIGKTHTQNKQLHKKAYATTILYFCSIWLVTSGTCYLVGDLIKSLTMPM